MCYRGVKLAHHIMNDVDLLAFATILEKSGYEGAYKLIQKELVPLAKKKRVSLYTAAANHYANAGEDQDTSYHQLHMAILFATQKFKPELEALDIYRPVKKRKRKK